MTDAIAANDSVESIDVDVETVSAPAAPTLFRDLPLPNEILRAVDDLGFSQCTPIQGRVLRFTLAGHDAIGRAQTGTGKTAAFLLTVIADFLKNPPSPERCLGEPRALVLAPTRELALQIARDAEDLGKYANLSVVTLVGGMDYEKQRRQLDRAPVDIVVATPGRLIDFANKQELFLDQVELLVIDEADRMLDMGFIPDVKRIVRLTPPKSHRQTLMFSATFTRDVLNLASQWTFYPVTVEIEPESVATETVEQKVYIVTADEKVALLYNLITTQSLERVMVFANRRDQTRRLTDVLKAHDISCALLSGDVPQEKRVKTLENFREGKIKVLVATDVAGRGIHIDGVSHVVNFTLPEQPDDYVHRIGRTGRAGASGTSISFACEDDGHLIPELESAIGRKLECLYPPAELLAAVPKVHVVHGASGAKPAPRKPRPSGAGASRPGARRH
ncbi:ATP-dependent RNA helicase RhlB [Paraperlucidibaca baekdonensis]|uniref:ATP-dependent RNA helicase RhlB n=1 Tax=Paraperlucidibaca baekdonensis TaxID=748120 RepID=A0A3E0HA27_9GAMM|nr:ATP-dependent RNA helicase RhlB [Paraperlucidibaca baekdonensis]